MSAGQLPGVVVPRVVVPRVVAPGVLGPWVVGLNWYKTFHRITLGHSNTSPIVLFSLGPVSEYGALIIIPIYTR